MAASGSWRTGSACPSSRWRARPSPTPRAAPAGAEAVSSSGPPWSSSCPPRKPGRAIAGGSLAEVDAVAGVDEVVVVAAAAVERRCA